MSPLETSVLVAYFFVLSILGIYGWHRYYLVYEYMKNKDKVPGGLKSVDDLWDKSLKGRVGVLSEMRDTTGLIMMQAGVDVSGKWADAKFDNAVDVFRKQVNDGQIRNIKGNAYLEDLKSEDTLAAICWSGDITTLNGEAGDKWQFAIPEAGGTLWNDNFVIPIGSPKKSASEELNNYYYQPEVAAEVAAWSTTSPRWSALRKRCRPSILSSPKTS